MNAPLLADCLLRVQVLALIFILAVSTASALPAGRPEYGKKIAALLPLTHGVRYRSGMEFKQNIEMIRCSRAVRSSAPEFASLGDICHRTPPSVGVDLRRFGEIQSCRKGKKSGSFIGAALKTKVAACQELNSGNANRGGA